MYLLRIRLLVVPGLTLSSRRDGVLYSTLEYTVYRVVFCVLCKLLSPKIP